jgi:DNA polymerase
MDINNKCVKCGLSFNADDEIDYKSYEVYCLDCLQRPKTAVKCNKCFFLTKSRSHITTGFGNRSRGLFFVGEAPGKRGCDKTKIPFKGDRSGEYFLQSLKKIGVSYANAYFTNAVKCCPPDNRAPTTLEIRVCNDKLFAEIAEAKLVVCVGNTAYRAIMGYSTNYSENYLKIIDNTTLIPHPSYILRFGRQKWYKKVLSRLKKLISEKTTALSKK